MAPARSGVLSDAFILQHCMKYQAVPMAAVTKVLGKTADGRPPPRPSSFNVMAKNLTTINPQLRMDKIVDTYRDELATVARELKVTRQQLVEGTRLGSRAPTPSTVSETSVTAADETPPGSLDGYEEFQPRPPDEPRTSKSFLTGRRSTFDPNDELRRRSNEFLAETEDDPRLMSPTEQAMLGTTFPLVGPSLNLRPRDFEYMRQQAAAAGAGPSRLVTDPQEYLALAGSGHGDVLGFDPYQLDRPSGSKY